MQAYGQTDTGCVRTRNQDYIYFSPEQTGDLENLFFLADGMGGYQAGDYASWYAVEGLVSYMKEQKGIPVVIRFRDTGSTDFLKTTWSQRAFTPQYPCSPGRCPIR